MGGRRKYYGLRDVVSYAGPTFTKPTCCRAVQPSYGVGVVGELLALGPGEVLDQWLTFLPRPDNHH